MLSIYLAGPIEGCTLEEATAWRKRIAAELGDQFRILDPMNGKHRIVEPGQMIVKDDYNPALAHLCSSDAIYYRDLFSVRQADVVLVNLEYVNRGARGTFFEMGFAAAFGKLLVVVAPQGGILGHPFVKMSTVKYQCMDTAVDFLRTLAN